MADRRILVGEIDPITSVVQHGTFAPGDALVDPLGFELVNLETPWFYGSGGDGNATITTNTTLSTNMMYENLTINAGVTLTLGGFLLCVRGQLTLGNGAVIQRNGASATSGTGAAAQTAQVYGIGGAGANGGSSATGPGSCLGGAGGRGGSTTVNTSSGNGGSAVVPADANGGLTVRGHLVALTLGTLLGSNGKFNGGAGGGGGAGSGGGGGAGGGIAVIFANQVLVPSGTATISANGGNGANGVGPNAGGGGGGGGGAVIVVSANAQPAGLVLQALGGTAGSPTAGSTTVVAAANGNNGFTAFYVWN